MKIEITRNSDTVTLRPRGLLAGGDAEELHVQLCKVIAERPRQVVLDGSGIMLADSRGLEVLVDSAERLIQTGRTLALTGMNSTLREALELTGLASLFRFADGPEVSVETPA
jgi:anti-anti-sigma factor